MSNEHIPKPLRLFDIFLAFHAFAGKTLRTTELANVLSDEELNVIERSLQKMALECKRYGTPDFVKLGEEIEQRIGQLPALEADVQRSDVQRSDRSPI